MSENSAVWKATRNGESCHFGEFSAAKAWGGKSGSVEKIEIVVRDFNVVPFNGITKLDLDADRTLENLSGKLKGFVLCGYDTDGNEFFSSTYADGGDALWLLERCKLKLLTITDEE